ncbi:MAG TPA: hypothetical protein VKQ30_20810 [Ktedonobacterales bacterium]|nr:hypothetical protein [Ktedonobacterales bacterium]
MDDLAETIRVQLQKRLGDMPHVTDVRIAPCNEMSIGGTGYFVAIHFEPGKHGGTIVDELDTMSRSQWLDDVAGCIRASLEPRRKPELVVSNV